MQTTYIFTVQRNYMVNMKSGRAVLIEFNYFIPISPRWDIGFSSFVTE